jgi:hypothetical protein
MTTPEGEVVYLDTKTLVMHNADGTIRESLDAIRHEATAEQRAGQTAARQEEPASGVGEREPAAVGAGARSGDAAAVGGRGSDTVTTGGRGGDGPGETGGRGDGDAPEGRGGTGPNDVGRTGDDAASDGSNDGPRSDGDGPGLTGQTGRPAFMREGDNPYGPRGSLSLEQIEEIQVYRANHEPGYMERYYKENGWRKNLKLQDESGFTPPQLARLSDDAPWIQSKETPAAPEPHFLDDDYVSVGADTVTSQARLEALDRAAQERHFAVQWDNVVKEWRAETGKTHEIHGTADSAAEWGEARGAYKESHTAMGKATEAFGENVAEHHYIAERYPDFGMQTLLGPKNGNDQFDQVWKHDDGRIVVVEAKSSTGTELGGRSLPNGKKVSQGSREYFFDILREMRKRGEIDLVEDLKAALKEGNLEYVVVKGERNSGTYTGYQYRRFDISRGTLP